jgi:hypothetical protein
MRENVIYEERVSSSWTQALFWGLTAIFSLLLAWRTVTSGADGLGVTFLLFALVFLFYSLNYRLLVIRLSSEALRLQFGIFTWAIPLDNVQASCPDDNLPALMKYGGAGIHFMFIRGRYRASFNFLEHPRVLIALRRPRVVRDVSFSTRYPDDVIRHLDAAVSARGAA